MIKQSPSQIFKSDLRGISKSDAFLNLSTFNFGTYQDKSREAFGNLEVLNEGILAPLQKVSRLISINTEVILLPLFGGIVYKDKQGSEDFIRIEQIKHLSLKSWDFFELSNPYETENVSYLEIWFSTKASNSGENSSKKDFSFSERNKMNSLFNFSATKGFIGSYDGRKEGLYQLENKNNGIFVFVINGAFEVENRLLQAKDGLSLSEIESVEWEALSENAILLLLEIPIEKL
jgi:hypothetical protein